LPGLPLRLNLPNLSLPRGKITGMSHQGPRFFVYLLSTYTSFENCLFNSFSHLLLALYVLLVFHFWSSLYINPLSDE
jgi:hypothetical protein